MSYPAFLLAEIVLSTAPRATAGDSAGPPIGGDGLVLAAGVVVGLLVFAGAMAIAISNWRATRKLREARRVAHIFDPRAQRRPLGEDRALNRVRKDDDGPRSRAA